MMFLEVVFTIFVVIVVKACYAVDWTSKRQCNYSKPGCLFFIKKWIFLLMCKVYGCWKLLSTRYNLGKQSKGRDSLRAFPTRRKYETEILYFNGFAETGQDVAEDTAIAVQLTALPDNHAELCLYLQVPGHGFLQHPSHPDTVACSKVHDNEQDGRNYAADGLLIELKEPNRQWRISYCGMMRMVDTLKDPRRWSDGKNLVYVKFGFTWTSYSPPYNFPEEINENILSEAASREFWSFGFFRKLNSFRGNHRYREQWGQLRGTLYVDGMEEGQMGRELTLRGARSHYTGQHNYNAYHRYVRVTAHQKNGLSLSLTVACVSDILTHVICGYVVQPDRRIRAITCCDLSLPRHGEDGRIPSLIQFNVTAGKHKCNVVCLTKLTPQVNNGSEWKGRTHHCFSNVFINSVPGRGIIEFYYRTPDATCPIERVKAISPFAARFPPTDSGKLFLTLGDPSCQNKKLVGELGAQVACLKALTLNKRMSEFYVMDGFCLTTLAFDLHVKENKDLRETLDNMTYVLRNGGNEDLRDICNRFYAQMVSSTLSASVTTVVAERFRKLAQASRRNCLHVHVKASLVGEIPLADESQRTEFENLTGVNQILKAVLKCWGNQCAYEAVLYRRQNGLDALPPIAVVVQAMVEDARSHGVITTCEETSGDPTILFIDANYVVKRVTSVDQSQPDRMVLRQSDDGSFRIVSQSIGLKQKITKQDAPGVTTSNIAVEYVQECCLSYDNVLRLGQLALDVKNMFKDEREISWITAPGKIYLCEASRVTNDPTRSEFENMHEFDSSYATDETWTTTSNIDGTFPDVATPLTISTIVRATAQGLQDVETASEDGEAVASIACGHALVNMHDLTPPAASAGMFDVEMENLVQREAGVDDEDRYHGPSPSLVRKLVGKIVLTWNVLKTAKAKLKTLTIENERSLRLAVSTHAAVDVFRVIDQKLLPSLRDVTCSHVTHGRKFGALRKLTRAVLTGCRKPDVSNITSLDMTTILSSRCDDVSEGIPDLLQRLSETIVDAGCKEEFVALKPLKAVEWLHSDECKDAAALYKKLLEDHGHRCIMELELREQSWSQDQTKLVAALQAIVENNSDHKSCPAFDVEALLDKLKTPLNSLQRVLLRFLVPWTRSAVREWDWSVSVKMKNIEHVKVAYWKLAKLMKSQCLLPDEDLAFFLTHFEIGRLINCPSLSATLVPRAIQRRHVHARQKNLVFPTVSHQIPQEPLSGPQHTTCDHLPFNTVLQGTPVSTGKVRAPVRIVSDLSDAFLIQNGEVLIVERPDIGWSAYYPLLAGLVTQVGEPNSQGSMIAAAFSLPCVVNVKNALNCFKTGEIVVLDGAGGTVQRASGPDPTTDSTSMLHA